MNGPVHEKLLGIQFCRGIAAVLVVLYHAGRMLALPQYVGHVAFGGIFNFGNAGVDFFFVLSGFIIFFVHEKDIGRPERLPSYMWSRATRIYPIYWFVSALALCLVLLHPDERALLDARYVVSSLLLLPQAQDPVLGVGWTLVHEMLFYWVFAAAIASRTIGFFIALSWLILSAFGDFLPAGSGAIAVVTSPFHIQFAMGVAAAFAVRRWSFRHSWLIAGAGLVAFVALAFKLDADPPFYQSSLCRWFLGCACMAIIFGVARMELDGQLTAGKWGALLGAGSYSIYLIHTLAIGILAKALLAIFPTLAGSDAILFPIVIFALGGGMMLFFIIERPVLRFAKTNAPFGPARRAA